MNIWIMSGRTESGDDYPSIKVWTHEPSSEEIFVELLARKEEFLWECEDGDDEYGCFPFPDGTYIYTDKGGKRWENLLTYTIEEDFAGSEDEDHDEEFIESLKAENAKLREIISCAEVQIAAVADQVLNPFAYTAAISALKILEKATKS